MLTQEQENEKRSIGMELAKWMQHDKMYCYTLVVYALQEGLITEDEAKTAKEELDKYYEKDNEVDKNKNKYMMALFKKHGFSPIKVLWRLIEQFPNKCIGDPVNCEFKPNNDKIIKDTDIPSVSYYEIINNIIEWGYLSKRMDKKHGLIYRIHFDAIMKEYSIQEQENETISDDQ